MESVAIITPTFNRAHLLEACVESAASQTHPHVAVYVCDDGSTDGTDELMGRLCERYPNVRYLRNRYRKGPQGPRMTALDVAGEEFVAFLDSDNRYYPEAVERCLERFRSNEKTDVVFFGQNCIRIDSADDACMDWMQESIIPDMYGDILVALLRMDVAVDMGNGLLRRSALDRAGGLDDEINAYTDFELHIRLAQSARYDSIEEPLMDYLIHGHQVTADPVARGAALAAIMRRHRQLFIGVGGRVAWRRVVYRLLGHARAAGGVQRYRLLTAALATGPLATLWSLRKFVRHGKSHPLVEAHAS